MEVTSGSNQTIELLKNHEKLRDLFRNLNNTQLVYEFTLAFKKTKLFNSLTRFRRKKIAHAINATQLENKNARYSVALDLDRFRHANARQAFEDPLNAVLIVIRFLLVHEFWSIV